MDYMLYGNLSHGATWKKCCIEVGALPIRCYSNERAKYYQDKHKAEQERSELLDRYSAGSFIMHPRFGRGRIVGIIGADVNCYAMVTFKDMETKRLSLTG